MSRPLSPAAQAVLDAAFPVYDEEESLYVVTGEQHAAMIAAAALKAAADHAEAVEIAISPGFAEIDLVLRASEIIAIAAELEGANA